jgi:predicted RNA-binding protein with TRAM domain
LHLTTGKAVLDGVLVVVLGVVLGDVLGVEITEVYTTLLLGTD